ncbi:hypothetical protein [Flavobacterium ovatum]|uniref:hypothetical protein n=1 Tax=Flavobacterium ovatum TaxID=1928857 RepID=UPI00344F76DB
MKNTGIVLIVLGAIMMIYTGFNYVTTEKIVDIGPIEINHEKNNPVTWSPLVGGVLFLGGIFFLVKNSKK